MKTNKISLKINITDSDPQITKLFRRFSMLDFESGYSRRQMGIAGGSVCEEHQHETTGAVQDTWVDTGEACDMDPDKCDWDDPHSSTR